MKKPISRAAGAALGQTILIITDGRLRAAAYRRVLFWPAIAGRTPSVTFIAVRR